MDHVTQTAQAVRQTVPLELVDAEGDVTRLEADLSYDPADPFANGYLVSDTWGVTGQAVQKPDQEMAPPRPLPGKPAS